MATEICATPESTHLAGGVAILLFRDGTVLLGLRASGTQGEGTWAPPGGKAEAGEDAEACARRELLEETGLSVVDLRFAGIVHDRATDGRTWNTLFLRASWAGGESRVQEPTACVEWRWFALVGLPTKPIRPFERLVATGWLAVAGDASYYRPEEAR